MRRFKLMLRERQLDVTCVIVPASFCGTTLRARGAQQAINMTLIERQELVGDTLVIIGRWSSRTWEPQDAAAGMCGLAPC